jgi:two-component system, NarL family, response regulator LiaR
MADYKNLLKRNKATIVYSISLAFLLFLLKWLELRFIIFDHSFEIYIGFIAVIFTTLGIWLALKLSRSQESLRERDAFGTKSKPDSYQSAERQDRVETVVVENEVYVNKNENLPSKDSGRHAGFVLDTSVVSLLNLSKRELEILSLLAQGHSNQEIAATLYVSLSTVKSHLQNIFEKLDVKRRTQAVEKAKRLNIIP